MSVHLLAIIQAVALLAFANGAPVFATKILGQRFAWPVDGGLVLPDGRPLFGPSKTIRGIVVAVAVTTAAAVALHLDWTTGALMAAAAMAGDLASSFVKRRLGLPSSSRATGLDQIPESLVPLIACRAALGLSALDIAIGVAVFFVGEVVLSRLLFRLRLRDRPY